jgi:hypothetical protein
MEMNMTNKYRIRFDELENQLIQVENTKHTNPNSYIRGEEYVDNELFNEWRIKVKNLLANACGKESEHYIDFVESEKPKNFDTNIRIFLRLKAVFHAAKEDYLGGYLSTVRDLVQAELFDDELGQAKELLDKKYHVAAAIIAGVVLETGIRELCKKNNIETGKLNKMNDDLAKNGVYNSLIQKQIIALAGIRNSAAHGRTDEFTIEQVENMIKEVETLLAHNLNG